MPKDIVPISEYDEMLKVANRIKKGELGNLFVHCIEEDKFYIYEDGYWKEIFEVELMKMILESPLFFSILRFPISRRNQITANLKIVLQRRLNLFNQKGYLNFDVGEFDPINLEMHQHDKDNYSTMRIEYPFNDKAECQLWLKTLDEIFQSDEKKISLLQEFFGYCITPDISHKKALLLLGDSDSGKSTVLNILRMMLGSKNCSSVPLKYISHPQYTPMMINKLVNIDADVSKDAQSYEAEFKIITSGEPISCNQKFIETFEFVPHCKIVLAANIFPKITDHSSAFYTRLILIPCERIFSEVEKNRQLVKQLSPELPGILNWSIQGLRRLNDRGMFEQHEFMKDAVQELEDENNPTNVFFNEHIEIESSDHVYIEKMELYDKYKKWCDQSKNYCLSRARFGGAVYKRFSKYTPKNTMIHSIGKRVWRNIKYVENKDEFIKNEEVIQWTD